MSTPIILDITIKKLRTVRSHWSSMIKMYTSRWLKIWNKSYIYKIGTNNTRFRFELLQQYQHLGTRKLKSSQFNISSNLSIFSKEDINFRVSFLIEITLTLFRCHLEPTISVLLNTQHFYVRLQRVSGLAKL